MVPFFNVLQVNVIWNRGIKGLGVYVMKLVNVLEKLQNEKAVFSRLCEPKLTHLCFFLYVVCFTIDRYDVSGVPADRIQRVLERDWIHLVHELGVLDSPNYLREKGKPVIALWGTILFIPPFPGTS